MKSLRVRGSLCVDYFRGVPGLLGRSGWPSKQVSGPFSEAQLKLRPATMCH